MSEIPDDLSGTLKDGKNVIAEPSGHSMEPLLHDKGTKVLIAPLEKKPEPGDIVLWHRKDGKYVMHRMIGESEKHYLLRGDNCVNTDRAVKRRVIGVVTDIYRNGRWFPVTDKRYLAYVRIWTSIFPLRKIFFNLRNKVNKPIKKIKSALRR